MGTLVKTSQEQLDELGDSLQVACGRAELGMMDVAEILTIGKNHDEFDGDDKGFMDWAIEWTGYGNKTIANYLRIYDKFGGIAKIRNPKNAIPFIALQLLAQQDVPKMVVNSTLRKFENVNPVNRPTISEVRKIVHDSTPHKPRLSSVVKYTVEERVDTPEGYSPKARYMLNLHVDADIEHIKLVCKHWKQKYHPDKQGGSDRVFKLICKAEKELLEARSEVE